MPTSPLLTLHCFFIHCLSYTFFPQAPPCAQPNAWSSDTLETVVALEKVPGPGDGEVSASVFWSLGEGMPAGVQGEHGAGKELLRQRNGEELWAAEPTVQGHGG